MAPKTRQKRRKITRPASYYRRERYVGTDVPGELVKRIDEEADRDERRRAGEVIVLLGEALDARLAARCAEATA